MIEHSFLGRWFLSLPFVSYLSPTRRRLAPPRDQTWWALVTLCLLEHNWLKEHVALRQEAAGLPNGRRYLRRGPAMADGLTDHIWS